MSLTKRISELERQVGVGVDCITITYENGYTETLTKAENEERDSVITEWLRDSFKGGPRK